MYTVSGKKEASGHSILAITLTILDSFVIFATNHPDTSLYLNIRKFNPTLQHRYVENMTSSKMPFTDKDGHLTKAFQKEKI